ncbi:uncharacterized protein TRIADDRAFT_53749 [Trichoplax adhaerens]|uniref:Uncharacterized protein n=1 Tax=Trichoplax adhaerens TaxID=10228 RepID=B3RQ23_TRIAD|nr:predicted protein [Trichoplax adhaerens]EDV28280.1 predicted protein [Trichoplax adhaerens]|eukprot:XP_002110114.1 predicted protein [Trichoplax adhaerens]
MTMNVKLLEWCRNFKRFRAYYLTTIKSLWFQDRIENLTTPVASVNDIESLELEDVADYATETTNGYPNQRNSHDPDSIYGQLADYRQSSIYEDWPEGRAKWRKKSEAKRNRIVDMMPSRKMGTTTRDSLDQWRRRSIQAQTLSRRHSRPSEDIRDHAASDFIAQFPSTLHSKNSRKVNKEIRSLPTNLRSKKAERSVDRNNILTLVMNTLYRTYQVAKMFNLPVLELNLEKSRTLKSQEY